MYNILLFLHVLVCITLVGLVLIQRGKGADIGAAFGSGASNTVFGSQGSGDFLSRATAYLAAAFFALSLAMTYLTHRQTQEVLAFPAVEGGGSSVAVPAVPLLPKLPD